MASETILELGLEINNMMKDLDDKVTKLFDTYTDGKGNLPKLPPYKEMSSYETRYNLLKNLTDCIDDAIDIKLRVNLLRNSFNSYLGIKATDKSESGAVTRLNASLKAHIEKLDGYKFELMDIIKNANNKVAALNAYQFSGEE